jgi:hypothetical protein
MENRSNFLNANYAVENPSVLILQSKGYTVVIRNHVDIREITYTAYRDDVHLAANSCLELLGLATLWETYGVNWRIQDPDMLTDCIEEVIDEAEDG